MFFKNILVFFYNSQKLILSFRILTFLNNYITPPARPPPPTNPKDKGT